MKVGRGEFLAGMYLQLQLLSDSFGLQMYIIYASLIFNTIAIEKHIIIKLGCFLVSFLTISMGQRRRDGQHRPQPLAAGRDEMLGDLGNQRNIRSGHRQNEIVDPGHVGLAQRQDRVDRPFGLPLRGADGQAHHASPLIRTLGTARLQ